jgi:F0F1-type ATP synthase assembly protein I
MNSEESGSTTWQFAGAGLERAGTVLVCRALGYAIDSYLGSDERLGTAGGALLGFAAGMTRLIRLALSMNRD